MFHTALDVNWTLLNNDLNYWSLNNFYAPVFIGVHSVNLLFALNQWKADPVFIARITSVQVMCFAYWLYFFSIHGVFEY